MGANDLAPAQKPRTPLGLKARVYTLAVMLCGVALLVTSARTASHASPKLLLLLLAAEVICSPFKIRLPLTTGPATMSLTYALDFLSLLLLGPSATMFVAMAGAWTQCTFNSKTGRRTPLYQTAFSMAAIVVSVAVAGEAFRVAGGVPGVLATENLSGPFPVAVIAYFVVNTLLVAAAIALVSGQPVLVVWRDNFLWAAPSYFLAAGAAAVAALSAAGGSLWLVPLAIIPLGLTYWAYRLYLARYAAAERHAVELAGLHESAVSALERARHSEQMLAIEKNGLATTLGAISDGVIKTDDNGVILYTNPVAERLSDEPPGTLVGRTLSEAFPFVDQTQGERSSRQVLVALKHSRGSPRVIEQNRSTILSPDGSAGTVWVFRDVTDAAHLEEERLKATKLESLAVLAGGLAHDFNNVLTAVTGNLQFATLDSSLDAETTEALTAAERACTRAIGLTKQLLTFSKGGAPVKATALISELIRDCTKFALSGSDIRSEFLIADDLWRADVDIGQLSQVVHNLVINAKQAMPAGGAIRVQCSNVNLSAAQVTAGGLPLTPGSYIALSITDEGIGIPPEHLTKIFDPYFTTKAAGNGLGLATSYSIVKAHGGHIAARSTVGQGTCFVIHLPASNKPIPEAAAAETAVGARTGRRVLIMDDEEEVSSVASRLLMRLGYVPEAVSDGNAAVTRYENAQIAGRPFDVVMLDLTVPGGMGGLETLERLRRIDPGVKAIVSSGYSDSSAMADFERHGFQGVIPKPYVLAEFKATFGRLAAAPVSNGHVISFPSAPRPASIPKTSLAG